MQIKYKSYNNVSNIKFYDLISIDSQHDSLQFINLDPKCLEYCYIFIKWWCSKHSGLQKMKPYATPN